MKKLKKNQNGMTLVEIIVAMTLLSVMMGMFMMVAVAAAQKNLENHNKSKEIYAETAEVALFNEAKGIILPKISKNSAIAGSTGNQCALSAGFTKGSLNTVTYGYKADDTGYSDKDLNLKFFQSKNISFVPEPAKGIYWMTLTNDTASDIDFYIEVENNGKFFNADGESVGNSVYITILANSNCQLGFLTTGDYFTFSKHGNYFDPTSPKDPSFDQVFDETAFTGCCELDSGKKTGFVAIKYSGSGTGFESAL